MNLRLPFPMVKGSEILRLLGCRQGESSAAIDSLIAGELERCSLVASPQAVLVHGRPEDPLPPGAEELPPLSCAQGFTAFALTLGPGPDDAVDDLFAAGESTRAVILDAVGSAAVEALTASLAQRVNQDLRSRGLMAGPVLAPGWSGWSLRKQQDFLAYLASAAIGLTATESGQLVPKKSSAGLFPWVPWGERADKCRSCSFVACTFRKTS